MLGPRAHHEKFHQLEDGSYPRIETCRKCVIAKARCAAKNQYKSREKADKQALNINIERRWWPGDCVKAYRCRYCRLWHLTTATRRREIEQVEKMRRKWLRRTHQKDQNFDYGYDPVEWDLPETG